MESASSGAKARWGACPHCGRPLGWDVLAHFGILHGRTASRGGPFFTVACPACGTRLRAEGGVGRRYRFSREGRSGSRRRVGRSLRQWFVFLFGRSPTRATADPHPRPAEQRLRSRRRPTAVVRRLAALGLPPDAGLEEARRAFRRIAKENHPDVHRSAPAEERERRRLVFVEALRAYRDLEKWLHPGR